MFLNVIVITCEMSNRFNYSLLTIYVFQDKDTSLYVPALETLRKLIRTSTTSMTSVPLPLKFLRNYYSRLKERCDTIETEESTKALLCSVVSILAMGQDRNLRDTLRYCLRAGEVDVGDWGHEYVR